MSQYVEMLLPFLTTNLWCLVYCLLLLSVSLKGDDAVYQLL